jgi:hypothetical protein
MIALWIAQRMMALIVTWSTAVSRWLGPDPEDDFDRWESEPDVILLAAHRSHRPHPSHR